MRKAQKQVHAYFFAMNKEGSMINLVVSDEQGIEKTTNKNCWRAVGKERGEPRVCGKEIPILLRRFICVAAGNRPKTM